MSGYQFTNVWFDEIKYLWDELIPQIRPRRVLEIGSFEGRSTCYLLENLSDETGLEIHCIDSFEGGIEHQAGGFVQSEMSQVESRFWHNTGLALQNAANSVRLEVHKGYSDIELAKLLAAGMGGYFDFVYVDGSHQVPDVLCDALLAFRLVRVGGIIGFDDYAWQEPLERLDLLRCPKMAIDFFTNAYRAKIRIVPCPVKQFYVEKLCT